MNYRLVVGASLVLALGCVARASERPLLHPAFGPNAVLQRGAKFPVWGWARPGSLVRAEFAGESENARADDTGRWSVELGPFSASKTPQSLVVECPEAGQKVVSDNLLVGDVWLCSGQSNMQMGLGGASNGPAEIARADAPLLRLGWVRRAIAWTPREVPEMDWRVCHPNTVAVGDWSVHGQPGGFSAVAYFLGRKLVDDLDVPIGVIQSTWGGTPIEAWMSAGDIRHSASFEEFLGALDAYQASAAAGTLAEILDEWWLRQDEGSSNHWEQVGLDDQRWDHLPAAEALALPAGQVRDGVTWVRKEIEIPAAWEGSDCTLRLGTVDDSDTTFWDGREIGSTHVWFEPREYRVPAAQARPGRHLLAVRVLNLGGPGGFSPAPGSLRLSRSSHPDDAIDLSLGWRVRASSDLRKLGRIPLGLVDEPSSPSLLYNAMIRPLEPLALTGFAWYQGEANVGESEVYGRLFPAMITGWRSGFRRPDAPFLITQLASFDPRDPPGQATWADLREAQRRTSQTVPRCALAVAIDIGEANDIHPGNKKEIGRRLALAAESLAYGKAVESSGPSVRQLVVEPGLVRVEFDHAAGLTTADGNPPVSFTVLGADGMWRDAQARIDGGSVVLSWSQPARAVRYAWANCPAVNLVNESGLPAIPFQAAIENQRP